MKDEEIKGLLYRLSMRNDPDFNEIGELFATLINETAALRDRVKFLENWQNNMRLEGKS